MPNLGVILHDWLNRPWEQARGALQLELSQLRSAINNKFGMAFGADDTLQADLIPGDSTVDSVYVSNQGTNHSLLWSRINLLNGVMNFLNVIFGGTGRVSFTAGLVLLGNGTSALSEVPDPGVDGLVLTGHPGLPPTWETPGVTTSYVPMSTGAEPLEIMSNGAGQVLLIGYNP